jgi:hypothetical protein
MTYAAATAYAEAAARGQRFAGRRLPRAGYLLAVTARCAHRIPLPSAPFS